MSQILVYASLIIYHKTFTKKLKAVHPKSCRGGEKEKEKERQLQRVLQQSANSNRKRKTIAKRYGLKRKHNKEEYLSIF